jgi:hypothetical protein
VVSRVSAVWISTDHSARTESGRVHNSASAYYFWNSETGVTTWDNPLQVQAAAESITSAIDSIAAKSSTPTAEDFGGIDPDLAYLDPNLARSRAGSSHAPVFKAAFNARTGRFQGDPSLNPDRISDYKRAERQQEAFYNKQAWDESLGGRGLRNSDDEKRNKRPSAKEVVCSLFVLHASNTS